MDKIVQGTKILFVITKSNWGGAQAYAYTLATHFHQAGAEVVVALGGTGENGSAPGLLETRLRTAQIRTIHVASFMRDMHAKRDMGALRELREIIRRERPDVLHVTSSKAGGLGAFAGRLERVPRIVFTSHGLAYDEPRPAIQKFLIYLATWATVLLAHATITISSDTYRRAKRLPFCARKVHLIYNGIGEIDFRTRDDARETLVPESAAPVWIGTIAELTRNKSLDTLIRAAAFLKARGLPFMLVIIGRGEEHNTLVHLIEREGLTEYVRLAGFVENAACYLTAFDIFALVSVKEGLPYVLLEAGKAGCAVVATRIAGTTDIVDDYTGLLVPPRSPEAIAHALGELIINQKMREEFTANLQERIGMNFSQQEMLQQTAELYLTS